MEVLNEQDAGQLPDDEQAAALASLRRGASEQESERAAELTSEADQQAEAEIALVNDLAAQNTQGLTMLMELAVPTLGTFGFPTVARVLAMPQPQAGGMTAGQTLAAAWGPVLAKYGVSLGMLGDRYGVEISAVMVTLPIAGALVKAVKADTIDKRAKATEAQPAGAPSEPPAEIVLGSVPEGA